MSTTQAPRQIAVPSIHFGNLILIDNPGAW